MNIPSCFYKPAKRAYIFPFEKGGLPFLPLFLIKNYAKTRTFLPNAYL